MESKSYIRLKYVTQTTFKQISFSSNIIENNFLAYICVRHQITFWQNKKRNKENSFAI